MWNVVFSTGLIYVIYLLLGGCIFFGLEMAGKLRTTEMERANASTNFERMNFTLLELNFSSESIDFVIDVWDEKLSPEFFTNTTETSSPKWTFGNAFFFAFYVISTIGYGDISPATMYGQLLACLYAIIGIPMHIIFFKLLGESFSGSYQNLSLAIKGEEDSLKRQMIIDLGFYISWTMVFFALPSIIFMFTEQWTFIEGVYYCFITLTTVGLGDYVAGDGVSDNITYYTLYKIIILCWIIYGMAFTTMVVDLLTHKIQMHLLFVFKCKWKKCDLRIRRILVDVEKLDIHFRLIRTQGIKHKFTMWNIRGDAKTGVDFQTTHLANMTVLAERVEAELLKHLSQVGADKRDAFPVRGTT